jgi:hypothetical protein
MSHLGGSRALASVACSSILAWAVGAELPSDATNGSGTDREGSMEGWAAGG